MRVWVGGSIPELRHLAVTQIEYVRVVGLNAPAAPLAVQTTSATPCSSAKTT
jgi:hypothetical protein